MLSSDLPTGYINKQVYSLKKRFKEDYIQSRYHTRPLICLRCEHDRSMHRTIQAFLPGMVKKGGGAIVNMSVGRILDPRRAQPLRLWYYSRPAAIGEERSRSRWTSSNRASASTRSARAPSYCSVVPRARRGAFQAQRQVAEGRPAGFHRPPADGPHRHRRGGGAARRLSRRQRFPSSSPATPT